MYQRIEDDSNEKVLPQPKFCVQTPNYTQCPNDLFDEWLPHLSGAELKVALVIIRKTFGYHKRRDCISLSQLENLTGLTRMSILSAIESLIEKGIIQKEIYGTFGQEKITYGINIQEGENHPRGGEYKNYTGGSIKIIPTKERSKEREREAAKPPEESDETLLAEKAEQHGVMTSQQCRNLIKRYGYQRVKKELAYYHDLPPRAKKLIKSPYAIIKTTLKG